ncbi:TetR family transcriptional regulator C-terminal domain-containing protein [Enterobacter hormaechei]
MSKTNLLYYYPSKEALYVAVMQQILDILAGTSQGVSRRAGPAGGDGGVIRLKLEVSRHYPQASRLFCLEMLQGAPLLQAELTGDLKQLVER